MKGQFLSFEKNQREFQEETKQLEKNQLIVNNANVNKNIQPEKNSKNSVQGQRKDFSVQKVQSIQNKGNAKTPSVPKQVRPLNVMKMMGDLYRKQ